MGVAQNIQIILGRGAARPVELMRELGLSRQTIQRELRRLLGEGKINKTGRPPQVFYQLVTGSGKTSRRELPEGISWEFWSSYPEVVEQYEAQLAYLEQHYLYITPDGRMLTGVAGFEQWASIVAPEQALTELIEEYVALREQADGLMKDGLWPSGSNYFSDVPELPGFGRTRLGQLVAHAAESQNTTLMGQIASEIRPALQRLVASQQIDLLAVTPPAGPRKIHLLERLKWDLALGLPELRLLRQYQGEIVVGSDSFTSQAERAAQARQTISLPELEPGQLAGKTILVMDDSVDPAVVLEEIRAKLRAAGARRVLGYAMVGPLPPEMLQ